MLRIVLPTGISSAVSPPMLHRFRRRDWLIRRAVATTFELRLKLLLLMLLLLHRSPNPSRRPKMPPSSRQPNEIASPPHNIRRRIIMGGRIDRRGRAVHHYRIIRRHIHDLRTGLLNHITLLFSMTLVLLLLLSRFQLPVSCAFLRMRCTASITSFTGPETRCLNLWSTGCRPQAFTTSANAARA